jgi:uncharacterized protein YbcI
MMPGESPTRAEIESAIADELMKVHHESYGTGASALQVHIRDDLVLAVIDVELTPAERTLLNAGEVDAVKIMRESFQDAIEPTFRAIVEHATGRTVIAFLSAMSIDPVYSIEFFRLGPESPSDLGEPEALDR